MIWATHWRTRRVRRRHARVVTAQKIGQVRRFESLNFGLIKELKMAALNTYYGDFHPTSKLPFVVEAREGQELKDARSELEQRVADVLPRVGAILFRGFQVSGVTDFEDFVRWFSTDLQNYDYGSTPRTNVAGKIYTSTEYPAPLCQDSCRPLSKRF